MSVIKFNRNFSELFNWDSDADPTTEQEYQGAVRNWTEVEMDIVDTLLWQPETDYTEENIVKTPSLPLHYVLVCTTGGTSGTTEPSYDNVQIGDSVTDGTVEWTVAKLAVAGDIPIVSDRAKVDASNIGVNAETDNSELWGSAIGGGEIAEDDGKLVTGGTVYAVTSGLASDIADNTDDIATNTANISQNATDIDIADKRISNIEKLLQGNLYDYQTDTDTAYTKTVPSGAMPYAGLEKVGGKTVVWNQLCKNGDFADSSGWGAINGTLAIASNVATITAGSSGSTAIMPRYDCPFVLNHKYFVRADAKFSVGANFYISIAGNTSSSGSCSKSIAAGDWVTAKGIFTNMVGDSKVLYLMATRYEGETYQYRNVNIFDLTLMFGAGNEPSTVAEFEEMFPVDFYEFNEGTLLSAGVTEVVSKNKNYINIADLVQGGINTAGQSVDSTIRVRTDDYISVVAEESYRLTADGTNVQVFYIFYYNSNKTLLSYLDISATTADITTPSNTAYVRVSYRKSNSADITPDEVINPTMYKLPIINNIYPIPAAIQALEGYGWSAGTAYNYIDFERKVFVQNVARVDLGTLTYSLNTGLLNCDRFYVGIGSMKGVDVNDVANAICPNFVVKSLVDANNYTNGVFAGDNIKRFWFYTTAGTYADTTAFKTAMSGKYLYYELETPVEIDISEYLTDDNLIQVESNGTLTFPNSNGTDYQIPVPSEETYMIDLQASL